jgi:hypothetical protein
LDGFRSRHGAIEHRIYGAATPGQPTSTYEYTDNAYPFVGYMLNSSGWNNSTSTNAGRTAAVFSRIFVNNSGQGDAVAYNAEVSVNSTKAGATSWLASPAGVILNGDVSATVDGIYLNAQEMDMEDNGHDVAAVGLVHNFFRTNHTEALGEVWVGYRGQSQGNQPVDALISGAGLFDWGIDLSTATFPNQQAVALRANQRIYLNTTNITPDGFPNGTQPGGQYISFDSGSGCITFSNISEVLSVSSVAVACNGELSVMGGIFPSADNSYACGGSTARFNAVWAVNGTIQTSDATLKTNIKPLPPSLPIVAAIDPITFQWIEGGHVTAETQETQLVQATETVTVPAEEIQVTNGVPTLVKATKQVEKPLFDAVGVVDAAGAPVMINVASKHKPPRLVQRTHQMPRMVQKTVAVTKQVPRPGKRTHWGFTADSIKAATPAGMDWAAYVKGEDGTEHIRPDQLIPVLWQAVRELAAEVAALKAKA